MRKLLFIGIFGTGLIYGLNRLLTGVRTQDAGTRITMDVVSVDLIGVQNTEVLFRVNTRINNPSSQTLHLNFVNLTGKLNTGGTIFIMREENLGTKYPVSGTSIKVVPLIARVGLVNLGLTAGQTFVKALIKKSGLPGSITITGEIKVNGFPQAINKTVPLNLS